MLSEIQNDGHLLHCLVQRVRQQWIFEGYTWIFEDYLFAYHWRRVSVVTRVSFARRGGNSVECYSCNRENIVINTKRWPTSRICVALYFRWDSSEFSKVILKFIILKISNMFNQNRQVALLNVVNVMNWVTWYDHVTWCLQVDRSAWLFTP